MIGNYLVIGYIDPGTGSLLLQTLIAGILGLLYYFRAALKKIASWLFRRRNDKEDGEAKESRKGD